MNKTIIDHWHITWMEQWDQDYIDLVEPGFIKIDAYGHGEFLFGVVHGIFHINPEAAIFSDNWEGSEEGDEAYGTIDGKIDKTGKLSGNITFWNGDESKFQAIRINSVMSESYSLSSACSSIKERT